MKRLSHVDPGDLIKPQLAAMKEEIKEYMEQEEDVLSYGLFPQVAMEYFKYREAQKYSIDKDLVDDEEKTYPV